jgi:chemotaxis protein MotB
MSGPQTIIIIKRRAKSYGVHHGGAWKVAYADFVTAMMSLFIVLWLVSSSEPIKKAVGGYFTDPKGFAKDAGNGMKGSGGEGISVKKDDLNKLKEKLEQVVRDSPALRKVREHVVFTITNEGLRVELLEGDGSTFFESGSPLPTEFGKDLLRKLAEEIGKLPNRVAVEGHTDSRPYLGGADYSNWELSADRANAARRLMQQTGIRDDQVIQVRGSADQSLRNKVNPNDGTNRRITLIIQYQTDPEPEPKKAEPGGKQNPAPAAPVAAPANPSPAHK